MTKPELKPVYPIHQNEFVTVPSKTWNTLCKTLNDVIEVLNAQTSTLSEHYEALKACKSDISKLATITEEIYEILE